MATALIIGNSREVSAGILIADSQYGPAYTYRDLNAFAAAGTTLHYYESRYWPYFLGNYSRKLPDPFPTGDVASQAGQDTWIVTGDAVSVPFFGSGFAIGDRTAPIGADRSWG